MDHEIQKASLWKRVAAGILDVILLLTLATGMAAALSALVGYDSYNQEYQQINQKYAAQFGIDLNISSEAYQNLTEQERQPYDAFDKAINGDSRAVYLYNMMINLMLLIITGGILIAFLVLELLMPLLMKNGQTVGKKVFSLCLVRNDGVRMNNIQLFTRTVLAKFAVETMIPVYMVLLLLFGQGNIVSILVVAAILLTQLFSMIATRNNCLLHDLMSGTVVVDYGTQRIFGSTQELIDYQAKMAAERAARQTY